jgi:hypothetical protein
VSGDGLQVFLYKNVFYLVKKPPVVGTSRNFTDLITEEMFSAWKPF